MEGPGETPALFVCAVRDAVQIMHVGLKAPEGGMRLLDLFCCAGGATVGYLRAGFEVVGVDLEPQKNYPCAFLQSDALALDVRFLRFFDVIHASPPCQGYTSMRHAPGAVGAPRLIGAVREMLKASGRPYVIENVEEARGDMVDPITLCGSMFGLGTQGHALRRHRLFESNIPIQPPRPCRHGGQPVVGVYGGHARNRAAKRGGRGTRDTWEGGHKVAMSEAMGGMAWATCAEISEAIPPAYSEHIGRQIVASLRAERGRSA